MTGQQPGSRVLRDDHGSAVPGTNGDLGALVNVAGAGIIADSNPVAEYEETRDKARAVIRALELAQAGLS